jgi:hypothetical protein
LRQVGGLLLGFPIYSIKQNLILHDQKPNTKKPQSKRKQKRTELEDTNDYD